VRTYKGPFLVTKDIADVDIVLKLDKQNKDKLVHHNKLKSYEGVNASKWIKITRQKMTRT